MKLNLNQKIYSAVMIILIILFAIFAGYYYLHRNNFAINNKQIDLLNNGIVNSDSLKDKANIFDSKLQADFDSNNFAEVL